MKPQFELERNTAVINFSAHYCNTEDELLNSQGFERVLTRFLKKLKKKESPVYEQLSYVCGEGQIASELTSLFKLLLVLEIDEIMQMNIDKLKARYPHGFEAEKSLHRKTGDI